MTVYLCTCGTSAAKREYLKGASFNADWVAQQGGVQAAAMALQMAFAQASITDDQALRTQLSAEIHSLARMGITANDTVILYSSETLDGQACAHAVKIYLEAKLMGLVCQVEVIKGLQVRDADKFRTHGVINFTQAVLRNINNYGAAQCVLNPTGGFKSLVPYTVLIGMIKQVAAKYIFEQSTALISLPLMPVEFANARIRAFWPLLEQIQRDSAIDVKAWETAIPYNERQVLEPLFERENQQITLSPIGLLVWEELSQPTALVPYLSRLAFEDLLKLRTNKNIRSEEFLTRIATNREQLERAIHLNWKPFFWLKPGEHTRDRYLVSIEGWRLLVWRIVDHEDYEQWLQRQRSSGDAVGLLQRERPAKYAPFVRLDLYE